MDRFQFCAKVEHVGNCLLWRGGLDGNGYGTLKHNGKRMGAHRFSYMTFKGGLDSALAIDHLCRTPACVNPEHLEQVTPRENTRRGNGFAGENSRKMKCVNGHEFDQENTYIRPSGNRDCKICVRARSLRYSRKLAGRSA